MAGTGASQSQITPLKPKASPRPTPPSSASSLDFDLSADEPWEGRSIPSSGAQSPLRGRTLHRIPNKSRLVTCATTRRDTKLGPADLDWRLRLTSRDSIPTPSEYDHTLLEPLPFERLRTSLSEELHRAATFDSSIDIGPFGGHRDTFGILRLRNLGNCRVNLPPMFFAQISQYLDFDTYKAVRLTCHSWSVAISDARPLILPPVAMLPAEILEKIYVELSPVDFNAARHTCRAWMLTSLEERLLMLMLKRGGWSRAVAADKEVIAEQDTERRASVVSDDWFLSKRLATECSFAPGWTGHGITNAPATTTGLQLTSEIDFSQVGITSASRDNRSRVMVRFTISACGNFLLAFESCMLYLYALRQASWYGDPQRYGGHLELLTSILFPDQVLAVSMDTSSHRYAVAALLQGSVGVVCDVDLMGLSPPQTPTIFRKSRIQTYDDGQGLVFIPPLSDERSNKASSLYTRATFGTVHNARSNQVYARTIMEAMLPEVRSAFFRPRTWAVGDNTEQPSSVKTPFHTHTPFNVITSMGSQATYRSLCSLDDPPRSVAICPQRRCIAFGCRQGLELHWADALSGQDLSRWFPLSAPSDFLFFMPAREFVDSARKLRLISSAAYADAVRDPMQRYQNTDYLERQEAVVNPDWHMHDARSVAPNAGNEYYRAMPLSDGYHLLITLPGSRELCLVRENPQSQSTGRLTRRFVFVGPRDEHGTSIVPYVYAAAPEMRWGLRVAAAYGDQLWIFVVPPDLFVENGNVREKPELFSDNDDGDAIPLQIAGVEIASVAYLTSLALDGSGGDLTLWAFTANAKAFVFQIAGSGFKAVTQREATSDGTIVLIRDADGDIVMNDAPTPPPEDGSLQSDGTTSLSQNWPCSFVPCFPSCNHNYCNGLLDIACGTMMTDADGTPTTQNAQFHATTVHHDLHTSLVPCIPACRHRYCNFLLYSDRSIFMAGSRDPSQSVPSDPSADPNVYVSSSSSASPKNPLFPASPNPFPEDEGYASGGGEEFEQAGGYSAIYVPPLLGRWSQEDDTDWVPDYLRENGAEIEDEGLGMDVMELCRCECEILGN